MTNVTGITQILEKGEANSKARQKPLLVYDQPLMLVKNTRNISVYVWYLKLS